MQYWDNCEKIWESLKIFAILPIHKMHQEAEKKGNKKVLLRERKRHTARRVVSTPPVVLTGHPTPAGYPPSWPGLGGYPTCVPPILTWPGGYPVRGGYPTWVCPILTCRGAPYLHSRVPPPILTWPGGISLPGYPPPSSVPPLSWPGRVPPSWTWLGTPPPGVCPMEFWVMLQSIMGYGYPPPRCGQTENITFPILRMRAVNRFSL